jgi:lipopolysaccharide transport system ATP-binding protein
LLELGSGFHPEYTGRENVILNGLLLGLTRAEIVARFDEIADFADIGEAIERPVKTYSSGMLVRLAFAVQVLTDPEILMVDEALSVGDFFFQQKCYARIRALREKGLTLVFVSHDLRTVRDLCSKALYLRQGRAEFSGDSSEAIRRYLREDTSFPGAPTGGGVSDEDVSTGTGSLAVWRRPRSSRGGPLLAVEIVNSQARPGRSVRIGDTLKVRVHFSTSGLDPGHISVVIKNRYDQVVSTVGSYTSGMTALSSQGAPSAVYELDIGMTLEAGAYAFMVAFGRAVASNRGEPVEDTGWIGPIDVEWDYDNERAPFLGMFGLPVTGRVVDGEADAHVDSFGGTLR